MIEMAFEVLRLYGWAAFFAFIYLSTVGALVWMLMKDKAALIVSIDDERTRMMSIAQIIQAETDAKREFSRSMKELTLAIQTEINQQAETMAYFKARDEFQGGRRR